MFTIRLVRFSIVLGYILFEKKAQIKLLTVMVNKILIMQFGLISFFNYVPIKITCNPRSDSVLIFSLIFRIELELSCVGSSNMRVFWGVHINTFHQVN